MKGRNILIVGGVTLGILAVLEVAARIVLSRMYDRKFDSSLIEPHKYGATDGLKANASGVVWGKAFHTDEMGGRKHTKDKKGKRKILVIGDSVTEGVGVEDGQTFANLLNDQIDSFDVRNISMIGWSTYDYRNALLQLVKTDSSIQSVYVFYCLNDIYGRSTTKELPPVGQKGWISKVNKALQNGYATYQIIKLLSYRKSDHYYQYDRAFYLDNTRVNSVMNDLSFMKSICDEKQISFMVILMPYQSQLDGRSDDLPQKVLSQKMQDHHILYADVLKRLPDVYRMDEMYLFADEIHLSYFGHQNILGGIIEIQ
ncbi:MAG: hypothetical protein JST83_05035 [Bacteroidetes bacterium]|nr:hypothetical protein [Bacteroidota bacterium]